MQVGGNLYVAGGRKLQGFLCLDATTGEVKAQLPKPTDASAIWADGKLFVLSADGTALRVSGRADARAFQLVRERADVEAALSVPLTHAGETLGVLNLAHHADPDALPESDLGFVEQPASLAGALIVRAREPSSKVVVTWPRSPTRASSPWLPSR